jgi:hypothetical protein
LEFESQFVSLPVSTPVPFLDGISGFLAVFSGMIFRFKRFLGEALRFCDGFLWVNLPKGKTLRQSIKESTALGLPLVRVKHPITEIRLSWAISHRYPLKVTYV